MPRELEDYRDNIALLSQMFPNRATITLEEAAQVIGCNKRTIADSKDAPVVKIGRRSVLPIVGLAKWMSKH